MFEEQRPITDADIGEMKIALDALYRVWPTHQDIRNAVMKEVRIRFGYLLQYEDDQTLPPEARALISILRESAQERAKERVEGTRRSTARTIAQKLNV